MTVRIVQPLFIAALAIAFAAPAHAGCNIFNPASCLGKGASRISGLVNPLQTTKNAVDATKKVNHEVANHNDEIVEHSKNTQKKINEATIAHTQESNDLIQHKNDSSSDSASSSGTPYYNNMGQPSGTASVGNGKAGYYTAAPYGSSGNASVTAPAGVSASTVTAPAPDASGRVNSGDVRFGTPNRIVAASADTSRSNGMVGSPTQVTPTGAPASADLPANIKIVNQGRIGTTTFIDGNTGKITYGTAMGDGSGNGTFTTQQGAQGTTPTPEQQARLSAVQGSINQQMQRVNNIQYNQRYYQP